MKGFLQGKLFRGAATIAVGTAVGQMIVLLASPILTRLYTPEEIGALAVYAAILSTLVVVASLRYQLAIPLPEEEAVARDLLVLSLLIAVGFSLIVAAVLLPTRSLVATWTNADALEDYFWMLPLSLLGAGCYQALNYWAIRENRFALLARTRVTQSVGMVGTQVGLGLAGSGPAGLLFGDAIGRAAGSGSLFLSAFRSKAIFSAGARVAGIKSAARTYRRFPLLSSGSGLLNAAGLFCPPVLMAAFYGPRAAGFFALGQRLIAVPVTLVSMSVSQVFFGRAAELARESRPELKAFVTRTGRRLLLIGSLPSALILVAGPYLFARIFGETWREAGVFTQLLIPSFLLQFAVSPLSQTLNILERQDLQLIWDFLRFILVVGSLMGPAALQWEAHTAVLTYGIVSAIAYAGLLYLARAEAGRSTTRE